MAVQAVMVSYNYSDEGEHAKILTVSASGILFSNRWVLTHGSILSPLKEAKIIENSKGKPILNETFYEGLPEMHVASEKKSEASNVYEDVERMSRERDVNAGLDHSSYLIRVLTGRIVHVWQCPVLDRCVDIMYSWTVGHKYGDVDQQTSQGRALFSVYVLIDLHSDYRGLQSLRPLSSLLDIVRSPPERGSTVEVYSTPFGCEAFLNTVSRGSICGAVGSLPSLLLTDASTALGSEGGPVFTEGPTKELIGMVVCSVSWCNGEWVGLTLVAPLAATLAAKLRVAVQPTVVRHNSSILASIDRTTVLVRRGPTWGAGVYLGGGYFLTCAHVVGTSPNVSVFCQQVHLTAIVRYKTADDRPFDLALLYADPYRCDHLTPATLAERSPEKGEAVLAAGYPYFNEKAVPSLRPTLAAGHVNNVSPSMLQSSCCVQAGFSGGPIFRITDAGTLEVVAIVVSNTQAHTGACYPYVNMAVPVAAFRHSLVAFLEDKDHSKLRSIESKSEMVQSQWRLLPYRSKI